MDVATKSADTALQYGVIGAVAVVFAIAIIYLFRRYERREAGLEAERKAVIQERESWKLREAEIRLEYEERHRVLVQEYAKTVLAQAQECAQAARAERDQNRAREDATRKEFAEIMETVADQASKSAAATTSVLEKLHDRFINPRRGRGS